MVTNHIIKDGAMAGVCHERKPALSREDGDSFSKEMLFQEAGDSQVYLLKGRISQGVKIDFD